MKTIFFKGLELKVFDRVYEPSEDSFLLAENVSVPNGASVLDLGTGSGIQGINAARLGASSVVSTDLEKKALENAKENSERLVPEATFEFRQGSLFEPVENEKFNVIIFNPPYVPSEEKKFEDLDGGKKGREALDGFLAGFSAHLEKGGNCFFLQTSLNGEKETGEILKKQGFEFEVVARKRLFFEELLVFRAWR
jgi:release factor glutamine methyltransferase